MMADLMTVIRKAIIAVYSYSRSRAHVAILTKKKTHRDCPKSENSDKISYAMESADKKEKGRGWMTAVICFSYFPLFWWIAAGLLLLLRRGFDIFPLPPMELTSGNYTPSAHWMIAILVISGTAIIFALAWAIIMCRYSVTGFIKRGLVLAWGCLTAAISGFLAFACLLNIGDIATHYGKKIFYGDLCLIEEWEEDCYDEVFTRYLWRINKSACTWYVGWDSRDLREKSGFCIPAGKNHKIPDGYHDIILIFKRGFFGWKRSDFRVVLSLNLLKKQNDELWGKINRHWWEGRSPWWERNNSLLKPKIFPPFIPGELAK